MNPTDALSESVWYQRTELQLTQDYFLLGFCQRKIGIVRTILYCESPLMCVHLIKCEHLGPQGKLHVSEQCNSSKSIFICKLFTQAKPSWSIRFGAMCYFSATLALLGVCGAEVLDKLCSFLCFPFNCCALFMAARGFLWHGPRLLQAASTAVIIDLHWRAKE